MGWMIQLSRHPIREHHQLFFLLIRIVIRDVHPKIVHSLHTSVHHETHREAGLFTWLEHHRTDGWHGRSTTLFDFDKWLLSEAQGLIPGVGQLKRDRNGFI